MTVTRRFVTGSVALIGSASVAAAAAAPGGGAAAASSRVVAHDQGFVSAIMKRCSYFRPNGCPFGPAAVTGDGHGRSLVAIDLEQSAGTCGAGIVWFFDVERLVARTGKLAPYAQAGPTGARAAGAHRFKVYYLVNRSSHADCAQWGAGGTDPYVYRWTGHAMLLVSGRPPRRPKVLAPGFKTLP
ncbi:MAG: hypothetical protein ACRDL5_00325 [Solirubrobacteraceae bacterium]